MAGARDKAASNYLRWRWLSFATRGWIAAPAHGAVTLIATPGSPEISTVELPPELRNLKDQFGRIKRDAALLLDGLTDVQVSWRPGVGRWSVVECLSHLNETAEQYLSAIDQAIERGVQRKQLGAGPYRYGWFGRWFARQLEPPPKRTFKAPSAFAPASDLSVSDVKRRFLMAQDELAQRIDRANGLDLGRVKVTSPVSRLIRFELGQCFHVVAAHERRHMWQAQRVLDADGFPRT